MTLWFKAIAHRGPRDDLIWVSFESLGGNPTGADGRLSSDLKPHLFANITSARLGLKLGCDHAPQHSAQLACSARTEACLELSLGL
jgi:hypothetical protein